MTECSYAVDQLERRVEASCLALALRLLVSHPSTLERTHPRNPGPNQEEAAELCLHGEKQEENSRGQPSFAGKVSIAAGRCPVASGRSRRLPCLYCGYRSDLPETVGREARIARVRFALRPSG